MVATISSKGQITIPRAIRTSLRLRTGDKVDFVFRGPDRLELVPHRASVTALRGMVRHSGPALSLADMSRAVGNGGEP